MNSNTPSQIGGNEVGYLSITTTSECPYVLLGASPNYYLARPKLIGPIGFISRSAY